MSLSSVENEQISRGLFTESSEVVTMQQFLPQPICSLVSSFAPYGNHNFASTPIFPVPSGPHCQQQYAELGYCYMPLGPNSSVMHDLCFLKTSSRPSDSVYKFRPYSQHEIDLSERFAAGMPASFAVPRIGSKNPEPASEACPTVPVPVMSRTSFNVGYYVPPSVQPGDPYGGLESVWTMHFSYLFSTYSEDIWSFGPLDVSEDVTEWQKFRDMAKVRFSCMTCTHGWTSMHGPVVFYYIFDKSSRKGHVRFLLTGQKCIACCSHKFQTPMWYPEEAQKVMTNLYYEVAAKVYGKVTPPQIKDRRHGRPRQQHLASNCQGCFMGICKLPTVGDQTNSS